MSDTSGFEIIKECGDDASKWAKRFRETAIKLGYSDMDEGWLIGWFANAIEAAHDKRTRCRIQVEEGGS